MSGIKGWSISNVDDYGMWTVHESNAQFPVTRHQYRMMCNKDILQLSSEDLNQSMSPHKISYHYTSSVTVSSSNTHPGCASCMLPIHVLLGHLDPWRWDRLVILKRWNGITTSCCTQFQKIAGLKNVQFLCRSIRRMQNGEYIYIHTYIYIYIYKECARRNMRDFGREFLILNYTDITQNTYVQSWTDTEIMAREMCGLLGCRRTVRRPWCHTCPMRLPDETW